MSENIKELIWELCLDGHEWDYNEVTGVLTVWK